MTRLIIVRHGQSIANHHHLFAGHSDFDLSEIGHRQAELVGKYLLEREKIDAIYASDLLRAYHTACHIGDAFGLPVIPDKNLREIYAGEWESLPFDYIAKHYPEEMEIWRHDYAKSRPVDGESTVEVYHRVVPHILSLARKHDGQCILLGTHATVVRAFACYARGYSAEETGKLPFCHNAAINIYTVEGDTVSIVEDNIIEHMEKEGLATSLPKSIQA